MNGSKGHTVVPIELRIAPADKARIRTRLEEIEAEIDLFCSDLVDYFEKPHSYQEVRDLVKNDLSEDYQNVKYLTIRYHDEHTDDIRHYESVLSVLKYTVLLTLVIKFLLDIDAWYKEIDDYSAWLEGSFNNLMGYRLSMYALGRLETRKAERQLARKKGGEAKARVFHVIKAEVVRLLDVKKPNAGWKSKAEAARALAEPIGQFQQKYPKKNRLKSDGIEDRIARWLYVDKIVKEAFDAGKRK